MNYQGLTNQLRPLVKSLTQLAYTLKSNDAGKDEPIDPEVVAELLYGIYGDDAIEKIGQILEKRKTVTKAWSESDHPRDPKTKRFIPKGSGEAKTAATDAVRKVLRGDHSVSPKEIADHLSILTMKQIRDLAAEHGRKVPKMLKADMIEMVKALVGKPAESAAPAPKQEEAKPEGKSEAKPAPAAKPKAESKPKPKPAPKPEGQRQERSEAKAEPKPAPAASSGSSDVPPPYTPSKNPRPVSEAAKDVADRVSKLFGSKKLMDADSPGHSWAFRRKLEETLDGVSQPDLVAIGDRVGLTGHDKLKPGALIDAIGGAIAKHTNWQLTEGPGSVRPIDGSTMSVEEYAKGLKSILDAVPTRRLSTRTIKESAKHLANLSKPKLIQVIEHLMPSLAGKVNGWSAQKNNTSL